MFNELRTLAEKKAILRNEFKKGLVLVAEARAEAKKIDKRTDRLIVLINQIKCDTQLGYHKDRIIERFYQSDRNKDIKKEQVNEVISFYENRPVY